MTLIVATSFNDGREVLMAADRRTLDSDNKIFRNHLSKLMSWDVGLNERMVCGVAGYSSIGDWLRFWKPPTVEPDEDDDAYIFRLVREMRVYLKEEEWLKEDDEGLTVIPGWGAGLIGWRGKIWYFDGGWSCIRSSKSYAAVGTGDDFALGAMWSLHETAPESARDPDYLLQHGIRAVPELYASVGNGWDFDFAMTLASATREE